MSVTYQRKTIFASDIEDLLKIFLPTLLVIPLIFVTKLQWLAWMGIIFFSVMDISHVFSTGIEAYFDPEERVKRKTLMLTGIGISIALFIVVFFAPVTQYIFFYSIIFHNMRQGLGLALIYYKKSEKKMVSIQVIKSAYYFLTLAPVLVYHFKRVYVDFGPLETYYFVIPMETFFSFSEDTLTRAVSISQIFYWLIFAVTFVYLFFKVEKRVLTTLLFFCGIYAFSYIGSETLLFPSLLLMASHAVPYLFLIHKRTKDLSQSSTLRSFPSLAIFVTVVMGACYYYFFYRNIGEVSQMTPLSKFFVIVPSYIHYAFDGHIWTKNNPRFGQFLEA